MGSMHRAGAPAQLRTLVQRGGVAGGPAASEEPAPIGLAGDLPHALLPGRQDVGAPHPLLGGSTGPPRSGDRRAPGMPLGLDEEAPEGRVGAIGVGRSEDDLAVAGELDLAGDAAVVGERDPPHLRRVVGDGGDLGPGLDRPVGPVEDDPVGGQGDVVAVGPGADRLVGGGPDAPARHVLHVAVLPRGVGSSVGAPAGDGEVLVPAVARAAVADHHRVREPPQQRHVRGCGVNGRVELSHRRALQLGVGQRGLVGARSGASGASAGAGCARRAGAPRRAPADRRGSGAARSGRSARWRARRGPCRGGGP